MVKPDVKVNYYQALELNSDASVEEIRKQYRKLALKYHPDRNPGKEEECNPKFQAISAAHEVLSDPATKAKYDTDRRRAGVSAPAPKATPARTGNPYAATSSYAPPPRRTQDPTGWSRPGASGAERFANFPGPSPTARAEPKTSAHAAWTSFGAGRNASHRHPNQPQPSNPSSQPRPPPVPPREPAASRRPAPPDLPKHTEAEIRAGMKYRPAPAGMSADTRSAWAHYNDASAQRPSYSRTNTGSRTPKPTAYNPLSPSSSERPASGGTSGYTHHYKDPEPPSPMHARQSMPPPPTQPYHGNGYPRSRAPSVDGRSSKPPNRHSAHQYSAAETFRPKADGLQRSQSYRGNGRPVQPQATPAPTSPRPRSASPVKNSSSHGHVKDDFKVGHDPDDYASSSSATSSSSGPDDAETGAFGPHRPRPKKMPTGPSVRLNGSVNAYPPASRSGYQSRRESQTGPSRHNSASAQGGQGPNANNIFSLNFNFVNNSQSKSRSAEDINTTFSPTSATPTFSGTPGVTANSPTAARRSSPSKRGRGTLSAQASRNHINARMPNDYFRNPASPTSPSEAQLFGEVKNPPADQTEFSPDQWQNHEFFSPQPHANLSRGPSLQQARHSIAKGSTAPDHNSNSSLNADAGSKNTPSASSIGDAMDIDPAPPAASKTSRPYAQPPSEWRKSYTPLPNHPVLEPERRRYSHNSTISQPPTTTSRLPDMASLNESLNPQPGLADMSNMANPLPHQPRPSQTPPGRLFAETSDRSQLPPLPIKLEAPQRLTRSTFKEYTARMHRYLSAVQSLQKQLSERDRQGTMCLDRVVGAGPSGLQSGEAAGRYDGVEGLARWLAECERWDALRERATSEAKSVVEEFVRVKGRVKKLAEEGILQD